MIVAWNVRKLVYDCIKSVYDQTKDIRFEIIYVDNASEDGSVDMVKKEFPQVIIIENNENKGFIKANNQAIEISKGRYVLLLNSDTIVLDNAIAKTVNFADSHPDAAVVGCKVMNPDKTLQRTCFMYPSVLNMFLSATYLYKIFPRSKFFGREQMTWWDFNENREVETICGCFSLVRKEAIEQVGSMDEGYFVYGDDPDWCYRFKENNWKIMFFPDAKIIHYGGQTTKRMAGKFLLQLLGAKLIFIKKHRSRLAFRSACFFTALFFFFRVPYWFLAGIASRDKKRQLLSTANTYLKGGFYCLVNWKNLLISKGTVTVEP
ncbi:MAG: glycosyltransferase family 2 protein [Phycisphaerales bacterium]